MTGLVELGRDAERERSEQLALTERSGANLSQGRWTNVPVPCDTFGMTSNLPDTYPSLDEIDAIFERQKAARIDGVQQAVAGARALAEALAAQEEAVRVARENVAAAERQYEQGRAAALATGTTERELAEDFKCPPLAPAPTDKKSSPKTSTGGGRAPVLSEEGRRKAIERVRAGKEPLTHIAKDIGVNAKTLRKWKEDADKAEGPVPSAVQEPPPAPNFPAPEPQPYVS